MSYLDSEDKCQLCLAEGNDKRTLVIDCFYAVNEVVPDMESITPRILNTHQQGWVMIMIKIVVIVLVLWASISIFSNPSCQEDMNCWECSTMGNQVCGR